MIEYMNRENALKGQVNSARGYAPGMEYMPIPIAPCSCSGTFPLSKGVAKPGDLSLTNSDCKSVGYANNYVGSGVGFG